MTKDKPPEQPKKTRAPTDEELEAAEAEKLLILHVLSQLRALHSQRRKIALGKFLGGKRSRRR